VIQNGANHTYQVILIQNKLWKSARGNGCTTTGSINAKLIQQ